MCKQQKDVNVSNLIQPPQRSIQNTWHNASGHGDYVDILNNNTGYSMIFKIRLNLMFGAKDTMQQGVYLVCTAYCPDVKIWVNSRAIPYLPWINYLVHAPRTVEEKFTCEE